MDGKDKYHVPVLGKTFNIIEMISRHPEGITFSGIINAAREPKASVFRILQTLEKSDWVEKKGDLYSLGNMFIHYGLLTLSDRDIRTQALPFMKELTARVQESSHIAILSGRESMILEVAESPRHIKPSSKIGSLLPLHCTSHGKVFLAFAVPEPAGSFLKGVDLEKKTPYTITDLKELEKEIEQVRAKGYAMDNLEFYSDVRCLAAPVWGPEKKCIGALGITATSQNFPEERIGEFAEAVCSTAKRLSAEMGGRSR